jgi:hypothetical protein
METYTPAIISDLAFRACSLENEVIFIVLTPLLIDKGDDGTSIVKLYPVLPEVQKKAPVNDPVETGRDKLPDLTCALTGVNITVPAKITMPLPKSDVILPGSTMVAFTLEFATAIAEP